MESEASALLQGLEMSTPGTIKGWIQEQGRCATEDGGASAALDSMRTKHETVQDCAAACVKNPTCGAFSVRSPGTQQPVECTYYAAGHAGNREERSLCYVKGADADA